MSTTHLLPHPDSAPPQAALMRSASTRYSSLNNANDSPYSTSARNDSSISDKFSLSPDPAAWGSNLLVGYAEPDDYLHNPDPKRDRNFDAGGSVFTSRGIMNLGCLALLCACLLALFLGYPVASYIVKKTETTTVTLLGLNASGEYPSFTDKWRLIDPDTPDDVKTRTGFKNDSEFTLVFSDEFNTDGRTFWPGDDPYWEAVDLHNWATDDLEWYSPSAINTSGGAMHITMSKTAHGSLNYTSGMVQSWNKFCFTGGILEVAVRLPGKNDISGLWPAVWTMGNLGRSGYGATTDGMWPYTYDSCDVGTLPNQTLDGKPTAALTTGSSTYNYSLSYLDGQRLSRCTCAGESHPGPKHADGTFVGRSAPEIDVYEAQIENERGAVSQSSQWAPFDAYYEWHNTSDTYTIYNTTRSIFNTYKGGVYQEASSVVSYTNQDCYELSGTGCFAIYAVEYKPGFDDAVRNGSFVHADGIVKNLQYISWINNNELMWTVYVAGFAGETNTEISARPVPQEPMFVIMNLAISTGFATIDYAGLVFPTTMSIDYIRIYQLSDSINYGCSPKDFPTAEYINTYEEAYVNPNLTTWVDGYGQTIPKNNLTDDCSTP
ncbi:beta-glucan synthesis-associated protein KRE6 [Fistulina hepatica ATCC 64428]|uniref:Beta-glucan synthesis-associated protein KRE6 n=1 Tax=Fistulina hepatica ATCC 64428 TaxID=1128425 RepID=A0A0D7ACH9_9AGAR|nr:beta-glucan synthesis-associated protein KRE6 [Fistulina hepatica ATCC 64428]